jgi:hypothetical protein
MCPAISAVSLTEQLEAAVEVEPLLRIIGLDKVIPESDSVILASNPHIKYAKNKTYGIAIAEVPGPDELRVEMIEIPSTKENEPGSVTRTKFRTPGGRAVIERIE